MAKAQQRPATPEGGELDELARLYGVEANYLDAFGTERRPAPEALTALLASLGAPIEDPGQAADALAERRAELAGRDLEPVVVVRPGTASEVSLSLDGRRTVRRVEGALELEGGQVLELGAGAGPHASGGRRWVHRLTLPGDLPPGYHRLRVELGDRHAEALVIAAPERAFVPAAEDGEARDWGVFLPLYALPGGRCWGAGDLTDLGQLLDWTGELGGRFVGTLPLLAGFLGGDLLESSPYAPASRLFWNELYVDPEAQPELGMAPAAQELLGSPAFVSARRRLQRAETVDYAELARLKRRVLSILAESFFEDAGQARREVFRAFAERRPEVEEYALFRSVGERRGEGWPAWPADLAPGRLRAGDGDPAAYRFHLYAQLAAAEQLAALAGRGAGLYLDLPLGAHAASYDTWAFRDLFAFGAAAGAPPDAFFTRGQVWGFPPLVPERQRRAGYRYFRAVLAEHLAHTSMLRLDHVMQLHRLFWVPRGFAASDGTYVRYPAEELYAVIALESERARAAVVGEDLGTVPEEVESGLQRHGVRRMYVLQYAVRDDPERPLAPVADDSLASLNTHDMPPFAAFWEGDDATLRRRLGLIDERQELEDRRARACLRRALTTFFRRLGFLPWEGEEPGSREVADAALRFLAAGPAVHLAINLEDLWGERAPQNVPGTTSERPNWRLKSRRSVGEILDDPDIRATLLRIDALRRREGNIVQDRQTRHPRSGARQARAGTAPARGASLLTDEDLYLFNEGRHFRLYEKLGAHPELRDGRPGTAFAVWAPNAASVSVVGDWNAWRHGADLLSPRGSSGIWEGFVPDLGPGTLYKLHVESRHREYRANKADPFAFRAEVPPRTGSVVWELGYEWGDAEWMAQRGEHHRLDAPLSIYEVHAGSFRRVPEEGGRSLTYRELAHALGDYVCEAGFTHVELLPVMEHPFYGSWGYQTTGYFAPTARYGDPQDFMYLVDHLHQRGIGVILDWVPSHFPTDEHGLAFFDGTHLFEHADPRQGFHPDWGSLIFNYGRNEVRSFLISSALFWLDRYHVDGLRVDAVASMLYLDYSRREGEWIPNQHGGRENLAAIRFLRELNEEIYRSFPDVQTVAEESTAWPAVSRPTYVGGLGFGLKWDMGWMHDTLEYMKRDPVHRKYHQGELTFRMIYAFTENFCLSLSHDEVVHGKGSLLRKMPGDDWQKLANLRLLYVYQYAQPGKKLLFMGDEIAQWDEWAHDGSLDWHLLDFAPHRGVRRLVEDLNRLYRGEAALHQLDCDAAGFEWLDASDAENSVLSFFRRGRRPEDLVLAVFNLTPVVRRNYRLGVPAGGTWREVLNSDAEIYGGSGQGNLGAVEASPLPLHGRSSSLTLTLPPLAALLLRPERSAG